MINLKTTRTNAICALAFAAMLIAVSCVITTSTSDTSTAAAGDSAATPYTVNMTKGQTWAYDTSFPVSLDPVVTIDKQGNSFTATDGSYASVTGKKVTVTIPSGTSITEYYIVIKAETTNPTQTASQYVKFVIDDTISISGVQTATGVVGKEFSWTPTVNVSGAVISVSEILPAGLSINSTTGAITGTPTTVSAAQSYTVTATASGQTATMTVTISVDAALTVSAPDKIYAAIGGSYDPASATASINGAVFSISDYGSLAGGSSKISINSTTGAITVNAASGDAGTYTITITATASGQTATTQVTLVISNQLVYESSPSAGYIMVG